MLERSFKLPEELSAYIDAACLRGEFTNPSAVVQAGLEALRDRQSGFETWLREEVGPSVDEVEKDPSCVIPAEEMFAALRRRIG